MCQICVEAEDGLEQRFPTEEFRIPKINALIRMSELWSKLAQLRAQ